MDPLEPGYQHRVYDLIVKNSIRAIGGEYKLGSSLPQETMRLCGVTNDEVGTAQFVVSVQVRLNETDAKNSKIIQEEMVHKFDSPPFFLNLLDIENANLEKSSLSAIKMALEQKTSEPELFDKFPGLKNLNIDSDDYPLIILMANYLQLESMENLEQLKAVLAFRVIDSIQYEQCVDMFIYPPWNDSYDIDAPDIERAFDIDLIFDIDGIARKIHFKIWHDMFVEYFEQILKATFLEGKNILIENEIPSPPEVPHVNGRQTIVNFLEDSFGYFQNAYILLHILTGSVPNYINKHIQDGKSDYVLQNTKNSLASLLAGGYIEYWRDALEIACSGIINSKLSADILSAAIDVFCALTETKFTESELNELQLISLKVVEEQIKGAFV